MRIKKKKKIIFYSQSFDNKTGKKMLDPTRVEIWEQYLSSMKVTLVTKNWKLKKNKNKNKKNKINKKKKKNKKKKILHKGTKLTKSFVVAKSKIGKSLEEFFMVGWMEIQRVKKFSSDFLFFVMPLIEKEVSVTLTWTPNM